MAAPEQETKQRDALKKSLSELMGIKAEELVREDELGRQLSFATGLPYFKRTLLLFRDLAEIDLNSVPYSRLVALTNSANQAMSQFSQIKQFSVEQQQNPISTRDALINQIRDSYDQYFDSVSPTIAYSAKKATDFNRLVEQARESVNTIKQLENEQKAAQQTQLKDLEETRDRVRRAAQEVGVAQHAIHFMTEAEEHKKAATKWLYSTVALSMLTLLLTLGAVIIYYIYLPSLSPAQSIQLAVLKLVAFSVLFSGLIASGRVYRAHRHNYVVNRHRQNALSTFETFAKASSDESTKNAVLLQATQCIFSAQPTGYVYQETDSGGGPALWELIPGFMGQIKK